MAVALMITASIAGVPLEPGGGRTAQAVLQERTIASGIADASGARGAKWRKIGFTAAQNGTGAFKLTWTGTGDLRFEVLRANSTVIGGNTTNARSPKTFSTTLTANSQYYVSIWAFSGTGTFTMSLAENFPDVDTAPPATPTGLTSPARTSGSITLGWAPTTDNVGVASYRVHRDGVLVGSPLATSFIDAGLSTSTTYSYTVTAVDAAGNTSPASSALEVATEPDGPPDVTPPAPPTNLRTSTVSHDSVSLVWDATPDETDVEYVLSRDGVDVGTSTTTSSTERGLAASTEYTYRVRALDAAGNASDWSNEAVVTTADAPPPPTGRPNVVVINLDDMRTDSLADLPKVREWIGNAGTTFPNGYVATPSCCPSRATLMSGRYVHNNGQYNQNNVGANLDLTVQRYLHDAGYFTGHAGKFLHWLNINTVAPHWDRWTYFKGGYTNVQMNFDGVTRSSQGYSTTITFDRGIEYLRDFEYRDDGTPFFIQLTPVAPHSPSTPEAKYATASVPPLARVPSHSETDRKDKPNFISFTNETYASGDAQRTAMTRALYSVDDQVDRFMKVLDALGELPNTMVIFTADNGYFFGEHGRGGKFLPYKEAVEVPFLIRWPGRVAAGAVDTRRVSHIDITPTILAAAGVTQNHVQLDGKDILSGYARPHAYSEYYYDTANANYVTTWASIRNDQYLYVEYYGTTTARTTVTFREYYDMVNDPYQMQNLLKDNTTANDPDVSSLSALLASHRDCAGRSCP